MLTVPANQESYCKTVTHLHRLEQSTFSPPALRQRFGSAGDRFCSESSAGADLSTEPHLSRVIVSFLLNRIRAQRCGGFSPPVNRAAGSRPRLPAGALLMFTRGTELLQRLDVCRGRRPKEGARVQVSMHNTP